MVEHPSLKAKPWRAHHSEAALCLVACSKRGTGGIAVRTLAPLAETIGPLHLLEEFSLAFLALGAPSRCTALPRRLANRLPTHHHSVRVDARGAKQDVRRALGDVSVPR